MVAMDGSSDVRRKTKTMVSTFFLGGSSARFLGKRLRKCMKAIPLFASDALAWLLANSPAGASRGFSLLRASSADSKKMGVPESLAAPAHVAWVCAGYPSWRSKPRLAAAIRMIWMIPLLALMAGRLSAQDTVQMFGPANYSAVMVIHLKDGATQSMDIAKQGTKWSSQVQMPGHGSMHQIILFDKKIMYMVMPQMCMSRPLPDLPPAGMLDEAYRNHAQITDMGPATVVVGEKSYACEQRKVVYADKTGAEYVMYVFTANDLQNFPVKMVMTSHGSTTTVTYEQISLTPPAATLFVPPENCRSMPTIPGMPGPTP